MYVVKAFYTKCMILFLNHLIFMGSLLLTYYNRYREDDTESYVAAQCHGNNVNVKAVSYESNRNVVAF